MPSISTAPSLPVLDDVSFASSPASSSRCSARPAAESRPCCGWSPGSSRRERACCARTAIRVTRPFPSRVVVFQDPTLFPWRTVWNNVALGLEAQGILKRQRHRVDAAIDLVGLSAVSQRLSASALRRHGAAGRAGPGAGQRSQVAAPRRAARQARFADAHHHAGGTRGTLAAQRFTALLVTHDVEEALFLANRVIVFSDRPAASRPTSRSIVPIRAIAAIPDWRNCATKFWACSDWTRHGERDRVIRYAKSRPMDSTPVPFRLRPGARWSLPPGDAARP